MMKSSFKIALALAVFLAVSLGIMLSPIFGVSDVQIDGLNRLTEDWIKKTASAETGQNIFLFHKSKAIKALKENPYVKDAYIEKQYPDTLIIQIKERELSGYVKYLENTYLYIDEKGVVLEVAPSFTEQLPVVEGLEFQEFTFGKTLEVNNSSAFNVVVTLAKLFKKYNLESQVIRVNVSDVSDIHLYAGKLDIAFGDIQNSDEKVRWIIAILEKLPDPDIAGTVDISNPNSNISNFRILK